MMHRSFKATVIKQPRYVIKLQKIIGVVGLVAVLSACVATAPKLNMYDPQAVANAVSVKRDDYKKIIDYEGPNVAKDSGDMVFIRAWKDEKKGGITYQIYVADYYSGEWRFYNTAHDSNGERLAATLISRDVSGCSKYGCSHTEHVALNITRDYLEKIKIRVLTSN